MSSVERKPESSVTLGDFVLLEKRASGSTGTVYLARQASMDRRVAVKVLHEHLADDGDFLTRFRREAHAAGRLKHPNIVEGIAAGESDGRHYIAMELIDGERLDQKLAREGPLPLDEALQIAIALARALEHAHARHIVHRDVKPSNVILTASGQVKLTDFGLVAAFPGAALLTRTGGVLGTPLYMAPEQANDSGKADSRSDIYALGVTLYELLTGSCPFRGDTPYSVLKAKEIGKYTDPRQLRRDLPLGVSGVLERMLSRNPLARYVSAGELITDLERLRREPSRVIWRRRTSGRRKGLLAAAAILLVSIAALGIVRQRSDTPPGLYPGDPMADAVRALAAGQSDRALRLLEAAQRHSPIAGPTERLLRELREGTVVLFQFEDEARQTLSPALPFASLPNLALSARDNYRLGFRSHRDCWVYAFQAEGGSRIAQLFPNPSLGSRDNLIRAGELVWWPGTEAEPRWLHLDGYHGDEQIYVVSFTDPLRDAKRFAARLLKAARRGRTTIPISEVLLPSDGPVRNCLATDHVEQLRFRHRS